MMDVGLAILSPSSPEADESSAHHAQLITAGRSGLVSSWLWPHMKTKNKARSRNNPLPEHSNPPPGADAIAAMEAREMQQFATC